MTENPEHYLPPRRSYELAELPDEAVPPHWLALFEPWFADALAASGPTEANAMQLATANAAGHPAVRTVLAKEFDERGVVFFTNYESAKARDLAVQPHAAAVFVWPALQRQVRFTGVAHMVTRAETEAYFASRPRGSQLGAWASPQSTPLASRAALDELLARTAQRFEGAPSIPAPQFWGGYRLVPDTVEFWQGRRDRLHDRIRYRRDDQMWIIERLAP